MKAWRMKLSDDEHRHWMNSWTLTLKLLPRMAIVLLLFYFVLWICGCASQSALQALEAEQRKMAADQNEFAVNTVKNFKTFGQAHNMLAKKHDEMDVRVKDLENRDDTVYQSAARVLERDLERSIHPVDNQAETAAQIELEPEPKGVMAKLGEDMAKSFESAKEFFNGKK